MNKEMVIQKIIGISMLLVCALVIVVCITGQTMEDKDTTPVLFLLPFSVYLLVSKDTVLY